MNYLVTGLMPQDWSYEKKEKFVHEFRYFIWDDPELFHLGPDHILRRCVPQEEHQAILEHCHAKPGGGHYASKITGHKVFECGFFWPTVFKDAHEFYLRCRACQASLNMGKKDHMPLTPIIEIEIFYVWGIDFMGPFPNSYGFEYILVVVDYVSRWVEATTTWTNDSKVEKFIFLRYGCPRAIISDGGAHFNNFKFRSLLKKFGVQHKVTMPYHPQANGQVELWNKEVKKILKRIVKLDGKDWANKLDEALWAYRTAYKTPLGMSPFRLIFGKSCHLPMELEYKAYWVIKKLNLYLEATGKHRFSNFMNCMN